MNSKLRYEEGFCVGDKSRVVGTVFTILVVLYKKRASDSLSIKSLQQKGSEIASCGFRLNMCIWNNSPEISERIEGSNIEWVDGQNNALPYIYNRVASDYFASGSDYLMIADDDTDFGAFDFFGLKEYINLYRSRELGWGVIVPQVCSGGELVSPGRRFLFKGKRVGSARAGLNKSKNMLVINSGLVVTSECFQRMRPFYDERLRFYGTDTDFMTRYERYFEYLIVLDCKVNHNLSEHSGSESLSRIRFRWLDSIYAMKITFGSGNLFVASLLRVYIAYLYLKFYIKYGNLLK